MFLLITSVFPPEPVVSASLARDLAEELSKITEVKVLTPRPSRPMGFQFDNRIKNKNDFEHIVVSSFIYPKSKIFGRMYESYSFGNHAVRFIKANKSNIKCIYLNSFPLLSQYLIVKASKKFSIPAIIHIQDIYPEALTNKIPYFGGIIKKILLPIDKFTLKNATKIIAISSKMADELIQTRNISPGKIEIIYNWQNENEFIKYKELLEVQGGSKPSSTEFTFMYLGNIGPVAGVDFLIKSYVEANIKGTRLIIAGSGSQKDLCLKLIESLKVNSIEFWDVPQGKVPEIQENANIMLLPMKKGTAQSSIPSKLIAYMFSEKPIIACVDEGSDIADIIKKAQCGWIVSPEDPEELMKILREVLLLPKGEIKKLGFNGYYFALEHFSKKVNMHKILRIIIEARSTGNK